MCADCCMTYGFCIKDASKKIGKSYAGDSEFDCEGKKKFIEYHILDFLILWMARHLDTLEEFDPKIGSSRRQNDIICDIMGNCGKEFHGRLTCRRQALRQSRKEPGKRMELITHDNKITLIGQMVYEEWRQAREAAGIPAFTLEDALRGCGVLANLGLEDALQRGLFLGVSEKFFTHPNPSLLMQGDYKVCKHRD